MPVRVRSWLFIETGTVYGLEPILETMLNVSIVIPAWNEQERINDCLLNATRQTVMPS